MFEELFVVCEIQCQRLNLVVLRYSSIDRNIKLTQSNIVTTDMQITLSSVQIIIIRMAPNTLNTVVYTFHFHRLVTPSELIAS